MVDDGVDLRLLARAYDRSAGDYDERFRALQRVKFCAAAPLFPRLPQSGLALDAGCGTALFAEWLLDAGEPHAEVREALRGLRWVGLDASAGMLQRARGRAVSPVVADLALPPLRPSSCALVVAFTSLLERVPEGLAALGALLQPGGVLLASFLAAEAPSARELSRSSGLSAQAGPLHAGQDALFLARRIA